VERKARQYIDLSDGKIRVALVVDLQFPDMKKAWISVLVADGSSSRWLQRSKLFHDDDIVQQPVGQVDLYLSDFVGLDGVPADYCRPSTAELDAGVSRYIPMPPLTTSANDSNPRQNPLDNPAIPPTCGHLSRGSLHAGSGKLQYRGWG
jgi:hypothetical protein